MSNFILEDNRALQEWAPLTTLLEKIPATIQIGLFTKDVNFTCIDIIAEFIAVGSNHGIVYWFNRKTQEMETLGCQNINSSITCIQVISTVDYMVAAGNNQGIVTIFQVPKQLPDSLPESWRPVKKKQVERFNVSDLHKVSITAVEWSKNGMTLFSGDQNGLVVLTEIDFYMHLSKSTEFLNEKYSVVQLSYQNRLLLISTLFRTIIVDKNDSNKIAQVGQKERKMLGRFGAVFFKNKNNIQEPIIYASRPGLRIWQADKSGIVLKTLILKEAIKSSSTRVKLLNPATDNSKKEIQKNSSFGIIMPFADDLLITYNHDVIYFIDPNTNMITSIISNLRKITDIACFKDEIFILEGERNILRIAYYPEVISFNAEDQSTLVTESNNTITLGFPSIGTTMKLNPIISALPCYRLKPFNIIQAISILPSVIIGIDTTSIINADEAVETLPSVSTNLDNHVVTGIDLIKENPENCSEDKKFLIDRKDIFQKIGEQEFEEIIFIPQKKNNKTINKTSQPINKNAETSQMNVVNTDNNDIQINFYESKKNNLLVKSNNPNKLLRSINIKNNEESQNNLESIQKSIQEKEKLLFNYLDLDLSIYMNKRQICNIKSNSCSSIPYNEHANEFTYAHTIDRNCKSLISEPIKKKLKVIKLNCLNLKK